MASDLQQQRAPSLLGALQPALQMTFSLKMSPLSRQRLQWSKCCSISRVRRAIRGCSEHGAGAGCHRRCRLRQQSRSVLLPLNLWLHFSACADPAPAPVMPDTATRSTSEGTDAASIAPPAANAGTTAEFVRPNNGSVAAAGGLPTGGASSSLEAGRRKVGTSTTQLAVPASNAHLQTLLAHPSSCSACR